MEWCFGTSVPPAVEASDDRPPRMVPGTCHVLHWSAASAVVLVFLMYVMVFYTRPQDIRAHFR